MNEQLWNEAREYLAGGVNSPVRAFKAAEMVPEFIKRSDGKYLYTEEGRKLLDFCLSWGAIILGHNHGVIRTALEEAITSGVSYGMPTKAETALAKAIMKSFPSIDRIRFVNSGTEAVMSAIRVARGFTGKNKILKFDGCYHGHSDSLLVKAGSGVAEVAESSSRGIPSGIVENTISISFNSKEEVKKVISQQGKDIACIIVEPVPCNMGVVPPEEGFLEFLRQITKENGILLIFDEVITGFRIAPGGMQEYLGIEADMTILGKIIGGGLPVGAFGGRKEIMDCLAPEGDVYQAGTLSGNPLAMKAGHAVISHLQQNPGIYKTMEETLSAFAGEFAKKSPLTMNTYRTVFTIFYTENPVRNYTEAQQQDVGLFRKIFAARLEKKIFTPPSMYEAGFLSPEHTLEDCLLLI